MPPELVAIVDKALAYEPGARYPNAGALGEDVRRFQTGQLVAAHRYTRRQRVTRFARRHRAPLSVAALASVAVAVLAWIGVSRIVEERDAATAARTDAEQRRTQAETQAAELLRRADQLTVMRARTLVETNPTEAIAVLKGIDPRSSVADDAIAIAKAAVLRGVAWGLPSLPGLTVALELSRDGKRVVQNSFDGKIQIVDLGTRRVVASLVKPRAEVHFVDDGRRLLLVSDHQPPSIYDPTSGAETVLAMPAIRRDAITPRGDLVAFIDEQRRVGVLDVRSQTVTALAANGAGELEIAANGSWIAFAQTDHKLSRLVVIDRSGRELLHRDGRVVALATSASGKLAATLDTEVIEVRPADPTPTVSVVPLGHDLLEGHYLIYVDDLLQIFGIDRVHTWNGKRVWDSAVMESLLFGRPAGEGALVAVTSDARLHVVNGDVHVTLLPPSTPDAMVRIAAQPGVSRFVTTGNDALFVWNLDEITPRVVDASDSGLFVDEHRILMLTGMPEDWTWLDIDTGEKRHGPPSLDGTFESIEVSHDDSRVLAIINNRDGNNALVIYPDLVHRIIVPRLAGRHIRLVTGDALVYSLGRGSVLGKIGDDEPRELVKLDGDVLSLSAEGPLRYAALSAKGELVKGRFDGKELVRTHVEVGDDAFIIADRAGRVLVATGPRLLAWDTDVHVVATLPASIQRIEAADTGMVLELANKDTYFLEAKPGAAPRRMPISSLSEARITDDGHTLFGIGQGMQVEAVELPSFARWTFPRAYTGSLRFTVTPSGRRLLQALPGRVAVWTLPAPDADLGDWLRELTNAEDDGALEWPWQRPARP